MFIKAKNYEKSDMVEVANSTVILIENNKYIYDIGQNTPYIKS